MFFVQPNSPEIKKRKQNKKQKTENKRNAPQYQPKKMPRPLLKCTQPNHQSGKRRHKNTNLEKIKPRKKIETIN